MHRTPLKTGQYDLIKQSQYCFGQYMGWRFTEFGLTSSSGSYVMDDFGYLVETFIPSHRVLS